MVRANHLPEGRAGSDERRKLSYRHESARPHPVRGRRFLHRSPRLDGRGCRQNREIPAPATRAAYRRWQSRARTRMLFFAVRANKRSVAVNLEGPARRSRSSRIWRNRQTYFAKISPPGRSSGSALAPMHPRHQPGHHLLPDQGFLGTGSPFEEKSRVRHDRTGGSGGLMSITGEEGGPPCKPGATIGDTGRYPGMIMAISVLRRLRPQVAHRRGRASATGDAGSPILHYVRNAFTFMERSGGKAAPRAGSKTVGGGNSSPLASTPAKAAVRTITSTSTPAAPTPSIGRVC